MSIHFFQRGYNVIFEHFNTQEDKPEPIKGSEKNFYVTKENCRSYFIVFLVNTVAIGCLTRPTVKNLFIVATGLSVIEIYLFKDIDKKKLSKIITVPALVATICSRYFFGKRADTNPSTSPPTAINQDEDLLTSDNKDQYIDIQKGEMTSSSVDPEETTTPLPIVSDLENLDPLSSVGEDQQNTTTSSSVDLEEAITPLPTVSDLENLDSLSSVGEGQQDTKTLNSVDPENLWPDEFIDQKDEKTLNSVDPENLWPDEFIDQKGEMTSSSVDSKEATTPPLVVEGQDVSDQMKKMSTLSEDAPGTQGGSTAGVTGVQFEIPKAKY